MKCTGDEREQLCGSIEFRRCWAKISELTLSSIVSSTVTRQNYWPPLLGRTNRKYNWQICTESVLYAHCAHSSNYLDQVLATLHDVSSRWNRSAKLFWLSWHNLTVLSRYSEVTETPLDRSKPFDWCTPKFVTNMLRVTFIELQFSKPNRSSWIFRWQRDFEGLYGRWHSTVHRIAIDNVTAFFPPIPSWKTFKLWTNNIPRSIMPL